MFKKLFCALIILAILATGLAMWGWYVIGTDPDAGIVIGPGPIPGNNYFVKTSAGKKLAWVEGPGTFLPTGMPVTLKVVYDDFGGGANFITSVKR